MSMSQASESVPVEGLPRPQFLADPAVERLWDVVSALSTELAATRGRLDALERILAGQGTITHGAVDAWQPPAEAAVARVQDMQDYTRRVFASLAQD
jgi:hypothetical protein